MKRFIAGIAVTAGIFGTAVPALAHTAYPIGTVNVRSGPGTQYGTVGSLSDGEKASVLSHEGDWLKVRTASGTVGFMADWVTREVFDDEVAYIQVDTAVLNLRNAPSTDAGVLGVVRQGQRYRLLEGLGDWYKIDVGSLGGAWVARDYVYRVQAPPATQPPATPPPDLPTEEGARQGVIKQVAAASATSMYMGRGTGFDHVAYVKAGEMLAYLESAEGWIKVQNAAGDRGWVDGTRVYLWDKNIGFAYQASYGVMEHDWRIRYLKVREVVPNGTGLAVRSGPAQDAAVKRSLQAGAQMKLLEVPPTEYVQVMLDDGEVGWVSRNWIRPVAGVPTESVRLVQPAPGILRLEIEGQAAPASVTHSNGYLRVSLAENDRRLSSLQIGQHGATEMTLDRNSLTVRFEHPVSYQVTQQSGTATVVEIRPVIAGVQAVRGTDRMTYRFAVTGQLTAEARRDAGSVLLTLPGALLKDGAQVVEGLSLQQTGSGATGGLTTAKPFALKRGLGYMDLVIYEPGLAGKTIVVDAGHGGSESGAVGPTGLREQDFNLAVALQLRNWLQAAGAKVVMTRTQDTRCASPTDLAKIPSDEQLRYDLNCRAVVSNTASADAFISIHANANPSRAERGTETYWAEENFNAPQSQVLSGLVQEEMLKALGLPSRGVKSDGFYVIKHSDAPAALAEVGFVSNYTEEALLKQDSFRAKTAESLFKALERFFR